MPSVAVLVCPACGGVSQRTLTPGEKAPVVVPCSCGGRRHVARFFRDRRKTQAPVPVDRRGVFTRPGSSRAQPAT